MEYFVEKGSVVREIWGKSDTTLFIFAGSAAEFALNKAVDWLYFSRSTSDRSAGKIVLNGNVCMKNHFCRK